MKILRFLLRSAVVLSIVGALGAGAVFAAYLAGQWLYGPELPSTEEIQSLELQVPLRIFTRDGRLIGEFGAERRAPLRYDELPRPLIQAFLAAEDDRFFEHPGVDYQGLLRAAWSLVTSGRISQGGSTITMQLARNVYLSNEQTFTRKFKEILLALRMEDELSKEQILETYLNKIFLGNRAYGVGAAAQVYFGKTVDELSLSEMAILAGLPKAPSRDNPAVSPQRAKQRRNYVLRRMHELGAIDDQAYEVALAAPVLPAVQNLNVEVEAQYVAEMVRAELFERYGESLYTRGYTVYTTLDSRRQQAAVDALRAALIAYDERHGYRGPEGHIDLAAAMAAPVDEAATAADAELSVLDERPQVPGTVTAVVIEHGAEGTQVLTRDREVLKLGPDFAAWAGLDGEHTLRPGDVIRLRRTTDGYRLTQIPEVQGAFVSIDPNNGAVQALVGGFDFFLGKFNRAVQARRQPGSGFKPFLYAAALAYGFTPASVILDAPVVFDDPALEDTWRPQNYSGKFYGPTRLREALVHSRNLVSIRLLQAIGIDYARQYISRFGFPLQRMPRDLSLALGSPTFTPMELARGYAVLANNGFLIEPFLIDEVRDAYGETLFKAKPAIACADCEAQRRAAAEAAAIAALDAGAGAEAARAEGADTGGEPPLAPRVVDPRVVYLMNDMLSDVVSRGTGARARVLGRSDLHGKTGTTNDETDAWFYGFTPRLVGVAWVGFDQPTPMGRGEVGGTTALPMWIDYMRVALSGVEEVQYPRPPGLVNVRINPVNGKLASAGSPGARFEIVQQEHIPEPDDSAPRDPYRDEREAADVEDIF